MFKKFADLNMTLHIVHEILRAKFNKVILIYIQQDAI